MSGPSSVSHPAWALTLQELVGAAERLEQRAGERDPPGGWLGIVDEAWDRVKRRPFEAQPLFAFRHTDENGKERVLAAAGWAERLLEEALRPVLHRAVEPLLVDGVHGYRPGRSTFTAAAALSAALAAGRRAVAFLDIADFFPSISRGLLEQRLTPLLPAPVKELIAALVAAPMQLEGKLVESARGIPLGRGVSPLLANLYLTEVDAWAQAAAGCYLRYGDDLCIACESVDARDRVEAGLAERLALLGLTLSERKAERLEFDGARPLFYLGHTVDEKGVYERVSGPRMSRMLSRAEAAGAGSKDPGAAAGQEGNAAGSRVPAPGPRTQTLYLTRPGVYLSMQRGLVQVRRGKEVLREVALHRVDRVLVLEGVAMSSGFLSACISNGIPVLFFVGRGRAYGSLVTGGMPNPIRLRAQYELHSNAERRIVLARAVLVAKFAAMLRRLARQTETGGPRAQIVECREKLAGCTSLAELDGVEGLATRAYYEGFAKRIRAEGFAFERRSKRPPRDPINSLLSFSYSLVFSEMQTAILAHGLDPYPGLLHELRRNHPALASDLVEPYRHLLADPFVLTLVNNKRVEAAGFERRPDGGVYMTAETRRTLLAAYETFMGSPLGGAHGVPPRRLIQAAARAMLHLVLGETQELVLPLSDQDLDEAAVLEPEVVS